MAASSKSSKAKVPVPTESDQELPQLPRFDSRDSWRHPRFQWFGYCKTEKDVVKYLDARGVKANEVKFDENDVCDYSGYNICMSRIEAFAKCVLRGNETGARNLNRSLWEDCGIFIK